MERRSQIRDVWFTWEELGKPQKGPKNTGHAGTISREGLSTPQPAGVKIVAPTFPALHVEGQMQCAKVAFLLGGDVTTVACLLSSISYWFYLLPTAGAIYDVTLNFRSSKNPSLLGILYGKKYEADMCVR